MSTFTWTASYEATESSQPKVRKFQAGDGYEQRISWSLHVNPKEWDLTFANRTDTERDEIAAFLDARAGAESFDWTPPRGTAGKYVCDSWQITLLNCNNNTVKCKFREVFEA